MWFRIKSIAVTVFWSFFRPLRLLYRHIFRPQLKGARVIVIKDGKMLLVRPNYAHRRWTFPGGRVEKNESFEEAARREANEEAGIHLDAIRFLYEYQNTYDGCPNTAQIFIGSTADETLQVDGIEIAEAAWFPLASLPSDRVARVDEALSIYRERGTQTV
jgi:ADP-ribose pyrophosphatase YjhB (NUDIX family)